MPKFNLFSTKTSIVFLTFIVIFPMILALTSEPPISPKHATRGSDDNGGDQGGVLIFHGSFGKIALPSSVVIVLIILVYNLLRRCTATDDSCSCSLRLTRNNGEIEMVELNITVQQASHPTSLVVDPN